MLTIAAQWGGTHHAAVATCQVTGVQPVKIPSVPTCPVNSRSVWCFCKEEQSYHTVMRQTTPHVCLPTVRSPISRLMRGFSEPHIRTFCQFTILDTWKHASSENITFVRKQGSSSMLDIEQSFRCSEYYAVNCTFLSIPISDLHAIKVEKINLEHSVYWSEVVSDKAMRIHVCYSSPQCKYVQQQIVSVHFIRFLKLY